MEKPVKWRLASISTSALMSTKSAPVPSPKVAIPVTKRSLVVIAVLTLILLPVNSSIVMSSETYKSPPT